MRRRFPRSSSARGLLTSAVVLLGVPSAHAQDCAAAGVPVVRVTAPSGAVSVLIGSVHAPVDGLCQPDASIMRDATQYVVEGIPAEGASDQAITAPAAALLATIRFPPVSESTTILPPAAWARALSDDQVVELERRARCMGFPERTALFAIRMESAAFASELSGRPCATPGLLSRDDVLTRAAAARGLTAHALETQAAAKVQRQQVPERIHAWAVYRNLSAGGDKPLREIVTALNSGDYNEISEILKRSFKTSDDAELFASLMTIGRNQAWIPRLRQYLNKGHAVINVGAVHVGGPQGLLDLLEKRGYKTQAVRVPAALPAELIDLFVNPGHIEVAPREGERESGAAPR